MLPYICLLPISTVRLFLSFIRSLHLFPPPFPSPFPPLCLSPTYANCTLLNVSTGTDCSTPPLSKPASLSSSLPRSTWLVLSTENISCLFSLDVCLCVCFWHVCVCVCPWLLANYIAIVCGCIYVYLYLCILYLRAYKCSYNLAAAAAAILYKFY